MSILPNGQRRARSLAFCALAGLVLAPLPQEETTRPERLVLEPGEHKLRDVIDHVAAFLGRNYLCREHDFQGLLPTFRLQTELSLSVNDAETVLSELALHEGFALVRLDADRGLYEWIWLHGDRQVALYHNCAEVPLEDLEQPAPVMPVRTIVPMGEAFGDNAIVGIANSIRSILAGHNEFSVSVVSTPGAIVLQGLRPAVASAAGVLQKLAQAQMRSSDAEDANQQHSRQGREIR